MWFWKTENEEGSNVISSHSWSKGLADPNFDPEIFSLPGIELIYESGKFSEMIDVFQQQKDALPADLPKRTDLGVYSMMYSMLKVNELRENYETKNNMKFDCVIRARFELRFNKWFPDAVFNLENYDLQYLWQSHTNVHPKYGLNDCLAFSNSSIMSHYMSVYNHINELSLFEGHNPELITYYHNKHIERRVNQELVGL